MAKGRCERDDECTKKGDDHAVARTDPFALMNRFATGALALSLGFAAMSMTSSPPLETVEVGSKPSYNFRTSPLYGMGVKSLADLQGKPTLVDFWGTR